MSLSCVIIGAVTAEVNDSSTKELMDYRVSNMHVQKYAFLERFFFAKTCVNNFFCELPQLTFHLVSSTWPWMAAGSVLNQLSTRIRHWLLSPFHTWMQTVLRHGCTHLHACTHNTHTHTEAFRRPWAHLHFNMHKFVPHTRPKTNSTLKCTHAHAHTRPHTNTNV